MTQLSAENCSSCRGNEPPIEEEALTACLEELPGWRVTDREGVQVLEKSYAIKPYTSALAFVQAVGELAEQVNHHPEVVLEWGRVTVRWWTHTIRGLHRNDCILAARCDDLYTRKFIQDQHR